MYPSLGSGRARAFDCAGHYKANTMELNVNRARFVQKQLGLEVNQHPGLP